MKSKRSWVGFTMSLVLACCCVLVAAGRRKNVAPMSAQGVLPAGMRDRD